MRSAGGILLAEALQANAALASLDLSSNKLDDAALVALLETLKVNRTLEDLDVVCNGIKVIDEDAVLNALRVNGMLGQFELEQNERFDGSPLGRSIRQILLENRKVRDALPYAGPSLELASGLAYPSEVMHAIARELAFLPPGKREEGRATIRHLSAAIQPPANTH